MNTILFAISLVALYIMWTRIWQPTLRLKSLCLLDDIKREVDDWVIKSGHNKDVDKIKQFYTCYDAAVFYNKHINAYHSVLLTCLFIKKNNLHKDMLQKESVEDEYTKFITNKVNRLLKVLFAQFAFSNFFLAVLLLLGFVIIFTLRLLQELYSNYVLMGKKRMEKGYIYNYGLSVICGLLLLVFPNSEAPYDKNINCSAFFCTVDTDK